MKDRGHVSLRLAGWNRLPEVPSATVRGWQAGRPQAASGSQNRQVTLKAPDWAV